MSTSCICRYGIDPQGKLAIGSKIATELLAKLLDDLRASKEESLATLTEAERTSTAGQQGLGQQGGDKTLNSLSRKSMPHLAAAAAKGGGQPPAAAGGSSGGGGQPPVAGGNGSGTAAAADAAAINRSISAGAALGAAAAAAAANGATAAAAADSGVEGHASGDEAEVEGFMGDDEGFYDEPSETMHRLCPTYASDINSPLR
jgi:inositol hexakisphosphate/diphosphoinositol-pentakisphosphate kinase